MNAARRDWLERMLRIEGNVMDALAAGELKKRMPLGFHGDRSEYAPLEAFGRCMLGLAPWLEADASALDDEERALQAAWREKAIRCIAMAVDPASPDCMNFSAGGQPLVDTAFLAHAIVRAPKSLAGALPEKTRRQLADAFRASRAIPAANCNWILFSAMVEAGLYVLGEPWDVMRVLYALRTFQTWYVGDGVYSDGALYHWDYYNSFVIQPMLVDISALMREEGGELTMMHAIFRARAVRYADILERMIGPEGSYPVVGRSICYRFGAFQMLSQAALMHMLPSHMSPAGVRCALTSVIHRVMSAPDMFDGDGWLTPGVYGYQPELAEGYINVGSLYLCTAVFLPLGLSPADPFWADPDEDWTGRKVWSGGHIVIDHAED